jgi:hypothetical protein
VCNHANARLYEATEAGYPPASLLCQFHKCSKSQDPSSDGLRWTAKYITAGHLSRKRMSSTTRLNGLYALHLMSAYASGTAIDGHYLEALSVTGCHEVVFTLGAPGHCLSDVVRAFWSTRLHYACRDESFRSFRRWVFRRPATNCLSPEADLSLFASCPVA